MLLFWDDEEVKRILLNFVMDFDETQILFEGYRRSIVLTGAVTETSIYFYLLILTVINFLLKNGILLFFFFQHFFFKEGKLFHEARIGVDLYYFYWYNGSFSLEMLENFLKGILKFFDKICSSNGGTSTFSSHAVNEDISLFPD